MNDETKAILTGAIEFWGKELQMDMVVEECAELIHVISAFRRRRATTDQLLDELADVIIMTGQLKVMFGPTRVQLHYNRKMERLEKRLMDSGWVKP